MEMSEIVTPTPEVEEPIFDYSEVLLQPGVRIRPNIQEDGVRRLAERLYGIICTEIIELNGYDDKNFLIQPDRNMKNPILTNDWPYGYVMKIMNSLDSKKIQFLEGQNAMMLFLAENNIKCPKPLQNVYAKYYSVEDIEKSQHIVRLMEFLPGKILKEVPYTYNLFFQVGEYAARLDRSLKKFTHPAYATHKSLWMLDSVPALRQFVYVIRDEARRDMVNDIIQAFEKNILAKADDVEKGLIHGDFNESNILVCRGSKEGEYRVAGALDFGDTQFSCVVFELAITMTYMMLLTGLLSTGGLVIAGYSTIRLITETEFKMLKYCVAARLCQSLVMGAYSHSLDPGNDYLLSTQKAGWTLLEELWPEPDEKIEQRWRLIADDYMKQSYK